METFDFPYHRQRTKYPENGVRAQFGGGYNFSAAPDAPDQRIFALEMSGMKFYADNAGVIDRSIYPDRNAAVLEDFYKAHGLWKSFLYPHPVHGDLVVKFKNPLDLPYGEKGGDGLLPTFEIELLEQP